MLIYNKKIRIKLISLMVLSFVCISSCKVIPDFHLYPGPERPIEEVAYLFFCPCAEGCIGGEIINVDNVPVPKCNQLFPGKACLMALLPGEHTVQVIVWSREVLFKFNAEAGNSYEVRCISRDIALFLRGQVHWLSLSKSLYINNLKTGKKVGEAKLVE